ncbi:type 2 isopentenyl-diphosphate Delta-isomerase, partial [Archaeoglobales archaeon]
MNTSNRKIEHVRICLEEEVESSYTGLEDVMLIHNAIPEIDFNEIDTAKEFFGKKLSIPLLIASMTGGHPKTKVINKNLAIAVEELGIGLGVGSQRAAIEDVSVVDTFTVVREYAPKAFIYANIGLPQILKHGVEYAEKAIEMIDADAIAIHLNFLQEAIQPEGDVIAKGCFNALKEVCNEIKIPVIAKETGAGISREIAIKLKQAGIDAIDVGGKGGTSWSGVEVYRAKDIISKNVGIDFWDWGIPTAFCIAECFDVLPIIATGGLRSGLDLAKAIALGAELGSVALPFLKAAVESSEKVKREIEYFTRGLKVAMFLTECREIK